MVDIYFYVFSYYKVKLALESESKTDLDEACQTLIESLPKGKIYSYFFEFGNLMHVICEIGSVWISKNMQCKNGFTVNLYQFWYHRIIVFICLLSNNAERIKFYWKFREFL